MTPKIPFKYVGNLNGPAYYKTCPIRNSYDDKMFKYHLHSTSKDKWEQLKSIHTIQHHKIIFLLEGEMHINWGEFKDVAVKPGEMFYLPRGAEISGYIVGSVSFVEAEISRGMTAKELDDLREMKNHERFDKYKFAPMVMHPPMLKLAESIKDYLVSGINCLHMHEAKFLELYVILHWHYSIADNAQLFYPMAGIGAVSEFRNFILDNYKINTPIDELVSKANMSRTTFNRKFKETFNTTPLKWIDELTRHAIISKASEPNVNVKDIMYEVGVSNPPQFTQLCKRLCGVTPSELIRLQ